MGVQIISSGSNGLQKDSIFAYFVNAAGKIIPAPDTRVSARQVGLDPEKWRRCEAYGIREIEKVSIVISRQLWEEKKQRTVLQRIREKNFLDQLAIRARLRMAQGFSKNDISLNQQLLAKCRRHEDELMQLIVSEFDPTKRHTALAIELHEESTSPLRNVGAKRQGIA